MTLSPAQLLALLPIMVIAATVLAVMGAVSWRRHHFAVATITVVGLNAALGSVLLVLLVAPIQVTPLLLVDHYALLYSGLILIAGLACSTLAQAYLDGFPDRREEFYMLLLCSVAGAITLVSSRHLASFFIGMELLSVPLYGMAAYCFRDRISLEAGIKYMVLSAAASAFMLFGMALLYGATGTLTFPGLAQAFAAGDDGPWLVTGTGMIVIALAFKLSLVPFHLWTPDVYEGSPAPASAFLSTVSKVAVFAVMLRFFQLAPGGDDGRLQLVIGVIAFVSMIVGNLLALQQSNVKRLLGYSSIAHLGYALTMVVASDGLAVEAAGVYLVTYVATVLGAFGVVSLVSSPYTGTDAGALHHYRGLFWTRPYLAIVLTVMMLSLAGIPLTAGFIGKFYAIAVGVQDQLWWLVAGIVIGSAIGVFYYLRVMVSMYLHEPGLRRRDAPGDWGQRSGGVMVMLLLLAVVFIGIAPQPLIALVRAAGLGSG